MLSVSTALAMPINDIVLSKTLPRAKFYHLILAKQIESDATAFIKPSKAINFETLLSCGIVK